MSVYDSNKGFSEAIEGWQDSGIPLEKDAGSAIEALAHTLEVKHGYDPLAALSIADASLRCAIYLRNYRELNQRSDQNG